MEEGLAASRKRVRMRPMVRQKHTFKRTPENLALLVETLRSTANVSAAARAVGISRCLAYEWRQLSEDDGGIEVTLTCGEALPLHEAWDDALEEATDALEGTARMLANGYRKVLTHQGHVTRRWCDDRLEWVEETITEYSEKLLEMLLKARRPEVYRERRDVRHSGQVKSGVLVVPASVSPEEWAKAAFQHQKNMDEMDDGD